MGRRVVPALASRTPPVHHGGVRPLADGRLVVFGPVHLAVLGLFVLGGVVAVVAGRRLRSRPAAEARVRVVAGVVIVLACGPFETLNWIHAVHHARYSLPIQICDVGWLVATIALLTGSRAWSGLLYYWGLTLCIQGVITPDLPHVFPQVQFFGYWVRHLVPPWAALYVIGSGVGPRWREYRITVVATLAMTGGAEMLNRLFGSNYDYLDAKPSSGSILNLFGPWPWYVVVEMLLVLGFWALMTWPWNRRTRTDPRMRGAATSPGDAQAPRTGAAPVRAARSPRQGSRSRRRRPA